MRLAELLLGGDQPGPALPEAVDTADAEDVAAVLALAGHADPKVRAEVAAVVPLLPHADPHRRWSRP